MSGSLETLLYEPALAQEVAALHAVLMPGRDPAFSTRYLAWKYQENPYIAEPLIILARHQGRIVGMRGFYGSLWDSEGQSAIIPCAADLVVDPAYQDRGIASLIMKHAQGALSARGYSHIFSLSAGRVTALGQRAQGFKSIAAMAPCMIDKRGMLDRLTVPAHFTQFDAGEAEHGGFTLGQHARPEDMAALIARLPYDGRLRHRRDAVYFAWRFRNPLSDYRFLFAGAGALTGYIALAAKRNDPAGPIWIVDWEAQDRALRAQLLQVATRLGRQRQIVAWRFGTDAQGADILAAAGFNPEAEAATLAGLKLGAMAKPLESAAAPLAHVMDGAGWDFRTIYSDFC